MLLSITNRIDKIPKESESDLQIWKVQSASDELTFYDVIEMHDGSIVCTCPDFVYRGNTCKHIYAVIEMESGQ
jgi:hypothetical protein